MKRFALAAVVLVLVGVSFAVAQRDESSKADTAKGILSELKVGEWITLDPDSGRFAFTIVQPVEGKTIDEYRKEQGQRLREQVKVQRDAEIAFTKARRGFESTKDREELEAASKQREEAMMAVKIAKPDFRVLWEVSEIHSDFVKLANGEQVTAIPEGSIRYISRDVD